MIDKTAEIIEQLVGVPIQLVNDDLEKDPELHTENEPWAPTRLALLNAVLDTMILGARFMVRYKENNEFDKLIIVQVDNPNERPRNLSNSLRDLSNVIE